MAAVDPEWYSTMTDSTLGGVIKLARVAEHEKRNFGLDLVRAVAITLVYLAHGVTALKSLAMGVDLFFVLSGFLIGRIYFRSQAKGEFSLWRFWQSRWLRTLPPYYAALGLYAVSAAWFGGDSVHWYYIFFAQNYMGLDGFGPSWSLCVEEHFYLALPLLAGLVDRVGGRRSFLWLLPVVAVLPQAFRSYSAWRNGGLAPVWWETHYHFEGLVMGVLLAYLFVERQDVWIRIRPLAFGLSLLPVLAVVSMSVSPSGIFTLHGALLIYALGFAGWVRALYDLRWEPLGRVGRYGKELIHGLALASYSIYLVHVLFLDGIREWVLAWPRGPVKSMFIMSVTMLMAVVFYFLVERPTISMRDRYLQRGKRILKVTAV